MQPNTVSRAPQSFSCTADNPPLRAERNFLTGTSGSSWEEAADVNSDLSGTLQIQTFPTTQIQTFPKLSTKKNVQIHFFHLRKYFVLWLAQLNPHNWNFAPKDINTQTNSLLARHLLNKQTIFDGALTFAQTSPSPEMRNWRFIYYLKKFTASFRSYFRIEVSFLP